MKLGTIVRSILAAALVTTAMVGASPTPAGAVNPGCGTVCDGKDPLTFRIYTGPYDWYTCGADAQTVGWAAEVSGGYIRSSVLLRYSPRCRTAWAYTDYERYIFVERRSPHRVEDSDPNGTGQYRTRMVNDAGYVSRACLYVPYGDYICTIWY
jgi:hypothetical protein